MSAITTPTTHKPGDHRNQRRGNTGRETRLISLRTQRGRLILSDIERVQRKLGNKKPGVLARLEHTLTQCNEELQRALDNATKFANRPDGSRETKDTFERGAQS